MDLAEGWPAFAGRGQKPSNKAVLTAIASIKKCRQGSFFNPGEKRPCSCGWHTNLKAAARKQARQAQSYSSASSRPANFLHTSVSPSVQPTSCAAVTSPSPSSSSTTVVSSSSSSTAPPFSPGSTTLSSSSSTAPPFSPGSTTLSSSSSTVLSSSSSTAPPLSSGGTILSSNSIVALALSSSSATAPSLFSSSTVAGSGPVPPKFDRSGFQVPTISELRVIGIGTKSCPGKQDLLVYCPLTGHCPHCKSSLIAANSVGKRKLCYAIPWPKTIVGVDMRCGRCKKHFTIQSTWTPCRQLSR